MSVIETSSRLMDVAMRMRGADLFKDRDLLRFVESELRTKDIILVIEADDSIKYVQRDDFLPSMGYLIHFNIASAKSKPHIEPLAAAHKTTSIQRMCMVEGQKQYVLEMEVALICVIKNGVMKPLYVGTLVDFGDQTPRLDGTGRTYKTWTQGVEDGGSTGASTTWVGINDWSQLDQTTLEYSITNPMGETLLYNPPALANSLKLWGARLATWVENYSKDKLDRLGIVEDVPFLISTGQILVEDDVAGRTIDSAITPEFLASGIMDLGAGRKIVTTMPAVTVPRNERTFTPVSPTDFWYEK